MVLSFFTIRGGKIVFYNIIMRKDLLGNQMSPTLACKTYKLKILEKKNYFQPLKIYIPFNLTLYMKNSKKYYTFKK